jgi:hypothetical protein
MPKAHHGQRRESDNLLDTAAQLDAGHFAVA